MSDRLQEFAVFIRAAETGSLSRTGRELGLSQPSVSRIVGALEARLGVRLLLRTTRRVTLTEAGVALLDHARRILGDVEAAEAAARGVDSLSGTLRVVMPVTFGLRAVVPHLPAFLAAHPALRVDLITSDEPQDLIAEGADIAIRLGPLADSGFGVRRLGSTTRHVIAAPSYLAARGTPATVAELAGHDLIAGPGGLPPTFGNRLPRLRVTSGEGVVACVRAGLGVSVGSRWMCGVDFAAGTIVTLLPDLPLAPAVVSALFPAGPHPSAKVRAFADHVSRWLTTANPPAALEAASPRV